MDAPPIPRLVDLIHAFKGVAVGQFKKRVEKLLSDSILLSRLLKLLFKILHWANSAKVCRLTEKISFAALSAMHLINLVLGELPF